MEFAPTLGGWLGVWKPLVLLVKMDNLKGRNFSDAFHVAVRGVAKTLVLFKSTTGSLCGGFLSVPWPEIDGHGRDPAGESFLFVLRNHLGDRPARGMSRKGQVSSPYSGLGPCFSGGAFDLALHQRGDLYREDSERMGFDNPIPRRDRDVFVRGGEEPCASFEVWRVG
jgi:hypothetical protein